MHRLSGTDALFVSMETPSWHQHVGAVVILDPSTAPAFGGFDAVRALVAGRLHLLPNYRWKLKEVPLRLDRPVWITDRDFDLDRHVRRIAVPAPGGPRELGALIGDLMSTPLDRRFPLWRLWYVDGVAHGKVALIAKYHHCIMDGMVGANLATVMCGLDASEPSGRAAPGDGERVLPDPSDVELLARSVGPLVTTPVRATAYGLRLARRLATMAPYRRDRSAPAVVAPATPFNGPVGARRRLAFASVSLDDVKRVAKTFDVTVNDVCLATVAGALRDQLTEMDALPERPLVVAVPVSTMGPEGGVKTNRIANMWVPLPTHFADPAERLRAIHEGTTSGKAMMRAVRSRAVPSAGEVLPPCVLGAATRAISALGVARHAPVTGGNLIVSNVPGPPFSLYICGAKVSGIYSASVLAWNIGMNITLMSYGDRVDFGVTVDPDLVPDPWPLAERLPGSLAGLMIAAGLGEPCAVHDPFAA